MTEVTPMQAGLLVWAKGEWDRQTKAAEARRGFCRECSAPIYIPPDVCLACAMGCGPGEPEYSGDESG